MIKAGYSNTPNLPNNPNLPNTSNIVIINSCAVTTKAEREVRQLIYQLKRKNPKLKIVVTGCATTNWLKLNRSLKEADLLVDNQNKEYLVELIDKKFSHSKKINVEDADLRPVQSSHDHYLRQVLSSTWLRSGRAIIKIQDGCQRFCTYCIVPNLRGKPKSKAVDNIINEINGLNENIKEVIFTAINTEAFGLDTEESLTELINKTIKQTKLKRISFGSINPWSLTDNFFKCYKKNIQTGRMVKYFHVPIQSGSDKILSLMKRNYTREWLSEALDKLCKIDPLVFIGTDIILGFLDETCRDFEDTYKFLEESPISKFHIFRFSKREHTAAYYMAKRLKEPDTQTKIKRAKALSDLSKRKYNSFLQEHVNQTFSCLLLEKKIDEFHEGLLNNQIPILVKSDNKDIAEIKNVKIIRYKNGRLFGKIV